ncbi:hypothetical protein P9112_010116 [Eukaryota sp. TZLM1-RC]
MLQYIPRCIAPEVLDTLLITHHISPRKPKKILNHVLSCTKIEDTAQAYKLYACGTLNLNCRDAEEAISKYTRVFVKVNRKTPTPQSNSQALTRKFLNGIRPEPLKRLLKSEAEDFLISSIPEILKRLTVLLPEYHRSLHYQLFEDRLANNAPLTSKFQPGDRVFVIRDKPARLHGHFVGPYVVEKQLTNSSILVKNPIAENLLKTSIHLVKPCTSSLPKEILDSSVAADKGEHVIAAIHSIDNNDATIIWSDGTSTVQPVDSIKNTAAYKRFLLLHEDVTKKKTRGKRK